MQLRCTSIVLGEAQQPPSIRHRVEHLIERTYPNHVHLADSHSPENPRVLPGSANRPAAQSTKRVIAQEVRV